MKKEIHPGLKSVEVTCNTCGTKFVTESTKESFTGVEVCSNCHPFYTGKTKNVSKGGRIDKFNAKYAPATPVAVVEEEPKAKKATKKADKEEETTEEK